METYIGNKLDWKQKQYIGNKLCRLETLVLDWKLNSWIGNSEFRLETKFVDWKHMFKNRTYQIEN